ncbi:hypothetical protein GQ43DRAFT_362950 [Delitschia confertaspora ATCC 74209]|uniref:Iron-sulfur assembly protein 1 n=1 Tax=Delitschia confertaspora ATCC 74209 TaxID=1513339 RepID=A0A9P4JVJ4_9PLEO|nr:hypothetical protein GQ43DRAFT_362950 [Delitschia confertaspora ATCC 74209]
MSLPRAFPSCTSTFLRLAAPPASRRCPQCYRTFSSLNSYRQSSRRQLQTASAYHPSSLHSEPPPRNFGVPETSIAGGRHPEATSNSPPRWTSSQQQQQQQQAPLRSASLTQQNPPNAALREGEAQLTKPVPQPSTTKSPLKHRRYNFGPRKAVIKLTPSAVSHLRDLLEQPEPKLIRIGTKAKGCSGLAYHLEYVDKPSKLDEQVEQDGVKVLIDNKALLNIIGSEMDWLEDKLNQRFVFKNPNATEQCGCGESFSVS